MNAHTREPFHIRILKGLLGIIWSIDWPLMVIVLILSAWGFVALYSAGYSFPWRIDGQIRNLAAAGAAMMLFATMPLKWTRNLAVPAYIVGLVLLVATLLFGVNTKGATRWLDIGVIRIQPSEIMKLATPLLIAWYFQIRLTAQEGVLKWWDYLVAFVMLALPVALILKQPDLGTSILVLASGFAVIFFAGLSWKFLLLLISGVLVALRLPASARAHAFGPELRSARRRVPHFAGDHCHRFRRNDRERLDERYPSAFGFHSRENE